MNIRKIKRSFAIIAAAVIVTVSTVNHDAVRVFAAENHVLSADTEKSEDQSANTEESGDLSADIAESEDQSADTEESGDLPAETEENDTQSSEVSESVVLPTDAVEPDIIAVDLPTLQEDEDSPFDFMIDPQNLLFETDAAVFGGGVVEEGANLLFHNREEGEFDFSRYSDKLHVTNRSTVPVMVTITAKITDADNLQLVQDKNFPEDGRPYVYLALVDDRGNEQPVSKDGEVSINVEMPRAPQNAYVYTVNSETGDSEYGLSGAPEDINFDTYSFGLTGDCSAKTDWSNISVYPKITVTWEVEPILTE